MKNMAVHAVIVFITMLIFSAALWINEYVFGQLQWFPGIHFVYLPAGVRLLCTLLFAEAGAVGLLLISWVVCFAYFFPDDHLRAFLGGITAALAPYVAYRLGQRWFGLQRSLAQLTPTKLLGLSTLYALLNASLHGLLFLALAQPQVASGTLAMFIGDLLGTMVVLYAIKAVLLCRSVLCTH